MVCSPVACGGVLRRAARRQAQCTRQEPKQLETRVNNVLVSVMPVCIAAIVVSAEPYVSALARGRQAVLPLCLILLAAAILHPRVRDILMSTLCYGVAILALRDMFRTVPGDINPAFNYEQVDFVRPLILALVALLAGGAGVLETVAPGTVAARRCYFGAAAVYAGGLGVLHWSGSGQSVVLVGTGLTALGAFVFADRIVNAGAPEDAPAVDTDIDEADQRVREERHLLAIRSKEWHDPATTVSNTDC